MFAGIKHIKTGTVLVNADRKVIYSNSCCRYNAIRSFKYIKASPNTKAGAWGIKILASYKVRIQREDKYFSAPQTEQRKIAVKKSMDLAKLKEIINHKKKKLNNLVANFEDLQSQEVLKLSRELDMLIYKYLTLEQRNC